MPSRSLGSWQPSSPGQRQGCWRQAGGKQRLEDGQKAVPSHLPYPVSLLTGLSLGPGNRKPFLTQALDPGPHVTSHLVPVLPESRCGHPAGGLTHKTKRHLGLGSRHSRPTPWCRINIQESGHGLYQAIRKRRNLVSQSQGNLGHSTRGWSLPTPLSDGLSHKSLLYLVLFFFL